MDVKISFLQIKNPLWNNLSIPLKMSADGYSQKGVNLYIGGGLTKKNNFKFNFIR